MSLYDPNNAPPNRRRAIWGALTKEKNHVEDETRKNADAQTNAVSEIDHGNGRRNHQEAVSERSDEAGRDKAPAVEANPNKDKPTSKEKVTCPKCGRKGNQGMSVHIKYCRGLNA